MTDEAILQLATVIVNSVQLMFLAYLTAKFRQNGGNSDK